MTVTGRAPGGRAATGRDPTRGGATRRDETRRLERIIGLVLRGGVLTSAGLMAVGLVGLLAGGGLGRLGRPAGDRSLGQLLSGLSAGRPEAVATLGTIVLVATPVLQLITSALLFWRKRDRLYTLVAVVVLGIVAVGALVASGGAG